jgi:hypothetical protein
VQPPNTTDPMLRQTVFIGCAAMLPGATATDNHGHTWLQKTNVIPLPAGTIVSLSIVYDEGDDQGASLGCPGLISCVYLDNIQVGPHVWTSASDNSNGETIMMSTDPVDELLGEPLDVALVQS